MNANGDNLKKPTTLGVWQVQQHPGNKGRKWKLVDDHRHQQGAMQLYFEQVKVLERGAVRLVDPDGVIAARHIHDEQPGIFSREMTFCSFGVAQVRMVRGRPFRVGDILNQPVDVEAEA